MMNLNARYPSFLKEKPKIWGMTIVEMFILSLILMILSYLEVRDFIIILVLIITYLIQTTLKRIYPKRHLEFALFTKNSVHMKDINEKLSL